MRAIRFSTPWAGLFAGPIAWAVSTQLNYALASWECEHGKRIVPFVALGLAVLALLGGLLSWRSRKAGDGGTEQFLATLGVLAAALFALVILMQGAAGLILNGCLQ